MQLKISAFDQKWYFDQEVPSTQLCFECARGIDMVRTKRVDLYGGIQEFSDAIEQLKRSAMKGLGDRSICERALTEIAELDKGYASVQQYLQESFGKYFPEDQSDNIGDAFITNSEKRIFAIIEDRYFLGHIHRFEELVDFKVLEDGQSIGDGKAAAVGALLAGAAGAVVGSTMTKKNTFIHQLDIVLSFRGLDAPLETISLLDKPTDKQSKLYAKKADLCQKITSALKQILESNKEQKPHMERGARAIYAFSVADEIIKFKRLMDEGVITQDEFNAQKAKLLSLDY